MIRKTVISAAAVVAICIGNVATFNVAEAFNFGNMMNPSRWFDDNDRYYDRYYDRGYGGYGPYGYGPYGGGYGPYGYGPHGGGYGPYGYPPYGGGYPGTIVVNPSGGNNNQAPPRLPE